METRTVGREDAGQKLLRFLRKVLPDAPDSFLHKMLRKKNIDLPGRGKCSGTEILEEGDIVRFFLSEETFRKFGGEPSHQESAVQFAPEEEMPLQNLAPLKDGAEELMIGKLESLGISVIYEDEDFLFVSKPAGLLVQGDQSGEKSLAGILRECSPPGSLTKWAPMHRLDRNTSGLVLCGKTVRGQQLLARSLKERNLKKEYIALTHGHLPGEGRFTAYHAKDHRSNTVRIYGKESPGTLPIETIFHEIARNGEYSLIRAELVTGRSHQIRAHLAYLGCPIVGDAKYGGRDNAGAAVRAQLLHAERVTFDDTAEKLAGRTFSAPIPASMKGVLHTYGFRE